MLSGLLLPIGKDILQSSSVADVLSVGGGAPTAALGAFLSPEELAAAVMLTIGLPGIWLPRIWLPGIWLPGIWLLLVLVIPMAVLRAWLMMPGAELGLPSLGAPMVMV